MPPFMRFIITDAVAAAVFEQFRVRLRPSRNANASMSSSPLSASLCEPLDLRALLSAPSSEYHTATHARQQLVSRAVQESCDPAARAPLAAALAPLLPTAVDSLLRPFVTLESEYEALPDIAFDSLVSLLRLLRNLCANEPEFQRGLCDAAIADLCQLAARLSAVARSRPPSGKRALIALRALLQLLCNMVTGIAECQALVWTPLLTGEKVGQWRLCDSFALAYDLNDDALAAASLALVYNCVVKSNNRFEQLMGSAGMHCSCWRVRPVASRFTQMMFSVFE